MKSLAVACVLLFLLFFGLGVPVRASVTAQAVINERIDVLLDFRNINSSIWEKIQNNSYLFNHTTFPKIVVDNLKQRYGFNATFSPLESLIELDNSTRSMRARFYLSGSDIISLSFNDTTMAKTYRVRTEWRKFHANFTSAQGVQIFSLNFTRYFGAPISFWRRINYTLNSEVHLAYFYNYTGQAEFDPLFYFVLPANAVHVQAVGETIIFEFPSSLGNMLLNSPFPIVGALIVITIAIVLYRKVRRI